MIEVNENLKEFLRYYLPKENIKELTQSFSSVIHIKRKAWALLLYKKSVPGLFLRQGYQRNYFLDILLIHDSH